MELPHLGQHCSESSCKQLDFLPMKCDACSKMFCREHIMYSIHSCTESYKKNKLVPVCPLCDLPCPLRAGDSADQVISRHIDSDCMSDPAKDKRKVYTNRCSKKGCRRKEAVPVVCEKCCQNFCFGHRHEQDHHCQGFQGLGRAVSKAGAAAMMRSQKQQVAAPSSNLKKITSSSTHESSKDGKPSQLGNNSSMTPQNEDEELAMAIYLSLQEKPKRLLDRDMGSFLLAQALAESQLMAAKPQVQPQQA